MKKFLPIYDAPIKGLQYFAPAIIFGHEETLPWFCSNYIQMEWDKNLFIKFSLMEHYYLGIPFLETQMITRERINSLNVDIIEMLISNIDNGLYTILSLNEIYIQNSENILSNNCIHDNMVRGYNKEKRQFLLFSYKNGELGDQWIDFNKVEKAYVSLNGLIENDRVNTLDYENIIYFIRYKEDAKYELDISAIKEQVKFFLSSENVSSKYKEIWNPNKDIIYGIGIYDELYNDYINCNYIITKDKRLLCTIFEHIKLMNIRLQYMINHGIMIDKELLNVFLKIEKTANIVRNLQLKYIIIEKDTICSHIADMLMETKSMIEKALNNLYKSI